MAISFYYLSHLAAEVCFFLVQFYIQLIFKHCFNANGLAGWTRCSFVLKVGCEAGCRSSCLESVGVALGFLILEAGSLVVRS